MTHFTTALDLHPKDNNMIKVAIDRCVIELRSLLLFLSMLLILSVLLD